MWKQSRRGPGHGHNHGSLFLQDAHEGVELQFPHSPAGTNTVCLSVFWQTTLLEKFFYVSKPSAFTASATSNPFLA